MRILLIYPNSTKLPWYFKFVIDDDVKETLPPLGMLYIISNSQYDIKFLDNRVQKYDDETLFNISASFDMVGFGGTIFDVQQAIEVSKRLMERGIKTVYGGPNATVNYKLYQNDFTCIVRGEAENWDWNLTDKVITLPRIKNLDALKFPKRINVDDYRRSYETYLIEKPVDTIVSSRGCPFDCSFCSSKIIWQRKYTCRSADNVLAEVNWLQDYHGTKAVYFREDNFTVNAGRLKTFCTLMSLPWVCEARADLSEDTVKMMADGGCKAILFGIEATNNDDLARLKKGITIEQVRQTINFCNKHGIKAIGMFILGFPWDTAKSIKARAEATQAMGLHIAVLGRLFMFQSRKCITR